MIYSVEKVVVRLSCLVFFYYIIPGPELAAFTPYVYLCVSLFIINNTQLNTFKILKI